MELVSPALELKDAFMDFTRDWESRGEDIVTYSARLLGRSYEDWLKDAIFFQQIAPEGYVPSHTLFLLDDAEIAGVVNIRHYLNDKLLERGGHIGYGVRPSRRGEGLATKMLAMALPVARQLGIERALITCDRDNLASARTIVKNGGVLENEVVHEGKITQRYWIDLNAELQCATEENV